MWYDLKMQYLGVIKYYWDDLEASTQLFTLSGFISVLFYIIIIIFIF